MSVEIICPLYEAFKYIEKLHNSLIKQEGNIAKITYLLTESKDETEEWLKKIR